MPIRKIFFTITAINTLLTLHLLFSSMSFADDSVSIGYQKVSQTKVVFTVKVSPPAPTSLIVQHYHSAKNNLVASSPRAQQVDNRRGYSKWLLRGVRPGVYPFSLTFNRPVDPKDIQLILRYRDPRGGGFIEKFAKP